MRLAVGGWRLAGRDGFGAGGWVSARHVAVCLGCWAVAGVASAYLPRASASLAVDRAFVQPGGAVTANVKVTFPTGYHAYQNPPTGEYEIPVKIELAKGSKFKLVKVKYPKGSLLKVAGEAKPSAVYTKTISIPVSLKAPSAKGQSSFSLIVSYQQCNATSCLPPDTLKLTAKVTVMVGGVPHASIQ